MARRLVARDTCRAPGPLLLVSGKDIHGQAFTERTQAVDVGGAELGFETTHDVTVGTRLLVEVFVPFALRRRLGARAAYTVRTMVSRVERSSGGSRFRIGVTPLADVSAT